MRVAYLKGNNFDFDNLNILSLTHCVLLISFDTPWKHQKTRGFLMFLEDIKQDQMFSGVQKETSNMNGLKGKC